MGQQVAMIYDLKGWSVFRDDDEDGDITYVALNDDLDAEVRFRGPGAKSHVELFLWALANMERVPKDITPKIAQR